MQEWIVLLLLKVLVMMVFFVMVLIVGTLPIRSKAFKESALLVSMGSTFAGALFLNVALVHILPQSAQTFARLLDDTYLQDFPAAYLLVLSGFLLTVFFTKIVFKHQHHQHSHETHQQSILDDDTINTKIIPKQVRSEHFLTQSYLLTIAIYFHTLFEGIAIGVQNDITGFAAIAVAIGFHKWADALSMGCHYRKRNIKDKIAYILIIGQAILNVVAIGVGWLISSGGDIAEATFLSISAGTFLAISTIQLLSESLHQRSYIYSKFIILCLATIFITGIWFAENKLFSKDQII